MGWYNITSCGLGLGELRWVWLKVGFWWFDWWHGVLEFCGGFSVLCDSSLAGVVCIIWV